MRLGTKEVIERGAAASLVDGGQGGSSGREATG